MVRHAHRRDDLQAYSPTSAHQTAALCQVALRATLENTDLLRAYEGLYARWPDVKMLLEGVGLAADFRDTVAGTPMPIDFRQHLTVM